MLFSPYSLEREIEVDCADYYQAAEVWQDQCQVPRVRAVRGEWRVCENGEMVGRVSE
jgi:hypothetical protein